MPFDGQISPEVAARDVLLRARDRLAKGRCAVKLRDGGNVCLIGAVACGMGWPDEKIEETDDPATDPYQATVPYLRLLGFVTAGHATDFNDALERTDEEVLARFDEAIEALSIGAVVR